MVGLIVSVAFVIVGVWIHSTENHKGQAPAYAGKTDKQIRSESDSLRYFLGMPINITVDSTGTTLHYSNGFKRLVPMSRSRKKLWD